MCQLSQHNWKILEKVNLGYWQTDVIIPVFYWGVWRRSRIMSASPPTTNSTNGGSDTGMTWDMYMYMYIIVSICIVIIIENCLTVVLMSSHQLLRTKTNYILISLAVVDCLTGSLWMFFTLGLDILPENYFCHIFYAFLGFSTMNTLLHLGLVSLERYIAIVYALHYHIYFSTRRLVAGIVSCWTVSFIIIICLFIAISPVNDPFCIKYAKFINYITLVCIGLISFWLILVYTTIYKEILRQQIRVQSIGFDQSGNEHSRIKAAKMILLTVGCFFLCWLPFGTCSLITLVDEDLYMSSPALQWYDYLSNILLLLNSTMNPIIYIMRMQSFRRVLCRLFTLWSLYKPTLDT